MNFMKIDLEVLPYHLHCCYTSKALEVETDILFVLSVVQYIQLCALLPGPLQLLQLSWSQLHFFS